MARHYVLGVAGVGGRMAGAVVAGVPVLGLLQMKGLAPSELAGAAPFVLLGLALALGSRGVTPDPGHQRIVRWWGLSLSRWVVLPLWRRTLPASDFASVCVRGHDPSGGRGPSKGWTVLLVPKRGYEHAIAVCRHLLHSRAEASARTLSAHSGVALEER